MTNSSLLTQVQRDDAERLWKSQLREVVDVRASSELEKKTPIPPREFDFLIKLYEFFLAHLYLWTDGGGGDAANSAHSSTRHLKYHETPPQSCLGAFSRVALVSAALQQQSLMDLEDHDENNNSELSGNTTTTTTTNSRRRSTKKVVRLWEGRRVITLHYEEFLDELHHFMLRGQPATEEWRLKHSFGAFLFHRPQPALACIGTAMSLAMVTLWRATQPTNSTANMGILQRFLDASQIQVRLIHVAPKLNMMDIKTGSVGKLITVKGHVVKARPKRLRVAIADFICGKCGACVIHSFDRGRFSVPTKCTTQNCKSRSFTMNRTMAHYINVQELRLQEAQEESTAHSGRTPRQMPVELTHDLVDSCRPGDIVLVACIVDTVNTAAAAGKTGKRAKETSTYTLVLQGHSITTLSETSRQNQRRGQQQQQQFTQQQLQSITQLCHADHKFFGMTERMAFPFDLLVRSVCPAIVGHHEVKAGILLCLLGGTPPATSYTRAASGEIRSNSHILVVG
jgi:DNA replicative helicase MCM subunit Mcm2 (Cdc46/Mcm family)